MSSWGSVFRKHVRSGEDMVYAAMMADEWERKNKPTTMHYNPLHGLGAVIFEPVCGIVAKPGHITAVKEQVTCGRCKRSIVFTRYSA